MPSSAPPPPSPNSAAVVPLRAVRLVAARSDALPPWCDLLVEEQDRWLVLGDQPDDTRRDSDPEAWAAALDGTPMDELLEAAIRSEPAPGGAVLLRRTRPLRLLAVVRDLEREPTVDPDWVGEALERILRVAGRSHVRGLALPLLGAGGTLDDIEAFADQLVQALHNVPLARVRIALLASPRATQRIAAAMRETAQGIRVELIEGSMPR